MINTQTPDGYIGNYAGDKHLLSWDIWGRKYCMLGLIAWYDLTRESRALKAAGKIADHLMSELQSGNLLIVKMGNHRGMAASSVLEPVSLLYARTGDETLPEFCHGDRSSMGDYLTDPNCCRKPELTFLKDFQNLWTTGTDGNRAKRPMK